MFGETQFSRSIERVGKYAGNAKPVFQVIGKDWLDMNSDQFGSEGSRSSGGWGDLAPSTVAQRGSAHPILDDTGLLRQLMESPESLTIHDEYLHFLLDDDRQEIAQLHQSGTDKMPQRRVFEFTEFDKDRMVKQLQSWVIHGRLFYP